MPISNRTSTRLIQECKSQSKSTRAVSLFFDFMIFDIYCLFLKVGGSATVTLRLICFFKTIETGIIILLDGFTFCEIKKGF